MMIQNLILFIVTSHSELGNSSIPTGLFLPEVAHAYYQLKDHFQIIFASPAGGIPPIDPDYIQDEETLAFLQDPIAMTALNTSIPLDNVVSKNYAGLFFPGGHGPMFDLAIHPTSHQITREIYEAGGVVGSVCHGPAGIVNVKLSTGDFLVNGKNVTGFSNTEEHEVNKAQYSPFLLEDQLKINGGTYSKGKANWDEHVVVDGRLVTGQNPASAGLAAAQVLKLLTNP